MSSDKMSRLEKSRIQKVPRGKSGTQSRQSAKLFHKSSELGLTPPLTRRRVCPPPGFGGRGTLTGERGVGRVPIPTRGHTLWFSLYIRTLWSGTLKALLPGPARTPGPVQSKKIRPLEKN
jgi:hypothetical protein